MALPALAVCIGAPGGSPTAPAAGARSPVRMIRHFFDTFVWSVPKLFFKLKGFPTPDIEMQEKRTTKGQNLRLQSMTTGNNMFLEFINLQIYKPQP